MLPFEKIRNPGTRVDPNAGGLNNSAVTGRPTSPPRTADVAHGAADTSVAPPLLSTFNVHRPHSRPTTQQGAAGAQQAHLSRARAVMLPTSPLPRNSSPTRGAGGRPPLSDAKTSPTKLSLSATAQKPRPRSTSPTNNTVSSVGVAPRDLAVKQEVVLNLKSFALDRALPQSCFNKATPPKLSVNIPNGNVVIHPSSSANNSGTTTTTVASPIGNDEGVDLVTIPCFCRFIVDADEVGGDRCLQYHVFVESPEMFVVQPTISVDGTLTFAVARSFTGSGCSAWIRLADNASVSPTGDISTSEPVPFLFTVPGRSTQTRQLPTAKDWHSFKNKATAPCVPVEGAASPTAGTKNDYAEERHYAFPVNNIHELREEGLDAPPAVYSDVRYQRIYLRMLEPLGYTALTTDLELLRFVHFMSERDRLSGETIPSDKRVDLEERLRARIKEEEVKRNGMDLANLVTRLAQVSLLKGAKGQGDAIECFERVLRLRMEDLGIASLADTKPLAKLTTPADGQRVEQLIHSVIVLSSVLKHVGRFAEGVEFASSGAAFAKVALGPDHPTHIRAMAQVGELKYLAGDYKGSLEIATQTLELCDIMFGSDHQTSTALRHVAGTCLTALGRPQEAMTMHTTALKAREAAFNTAQDHKEGDLPHLAFLVAESLSCVARCAHQACDTEAANLAIDQCTQILSQYDVSHSPEYAVASGSLATIASDIFAARGQHLAGIKALTKAHGDISRTRGDDSVEAAVLGIHLALSFIKFFTYTQNACAPSAMDLEHVGLHEADFSVKGIRARITRGVTILLSAFGPSHPFAWKAQAIQAHVEGCLGLVLPAESVKLAEKAAVAARKCLGEAHRDLIGSVEILGVVGVVARDNATARAAFDRALNIVNNHPTLASRKQSIFTRLCLLHGRTREPFAEHTIAQIEELYMRTKAALGESSVECLEPLQNLAEAVFSSGNYERTHHFLTKALKIADSGNMIFLLGPLFKPAAQLSSQDVNERNRLAAKRLESPSAAAAFAAVLFSIAAAFEAQGRTQEAQSTLLQVLASLELSQQHSGVKTAVTLRALGTLLFRDGFYGDALAYCEKALALLLDHHPGAKEQIQECHNAIDIIDKQLQSCGYVLTRHYESRYRFTVFV